MSFPRISNLFYVSYFREKSLIYDLRVSENSTYVTRSIKPRMYVHGILTPPDNLQMQLHVGSPKNWQVLDLIILYKHVHINIYICTINNISTTNHHLLIGVWNHLLLLLHSLNSSEYTNNYFCCTRGKIYLWYGSAFFIFSLFSCRKNALDIILMSWIYDGCNQNSIRR